MKLSKIAQEIRELVKVRQEDLGLTFEEDDHIYTMNGKKDYPSVSKVLKQFYTELENETGASFFHPIQIRRLFSSEQEHDFWLKKEKKDSFQPYMHAVNLDDYSYDECKNPFGSGFSR